MKWLYWCLVISIVVATLADVPTEEERRIARRRWRRRQRRIQRIRQMLQDQPPPFSLYNTFRNESLRRGTRHFFPTTNPSARRMSTPRLTSSPRTTTTSYYPSRTSSTPTHLPTSSSNRETTPAWPQSSSTTLAWSSPSSRDTTPTSFVFQPSTAAAMRPSTTPAMSAPVLAPPPTNTISTTPMTAVAPRRSDTSPPPDELPQASPSAGPIIYRDGQLRLVGGREEHEGNIQIFHAGEWGSICDDEWDESEARIACKQMGFPGLTAPTHSSQFGYSLSKIWMDNMYCYGSEKKITDCRFDGWGVHDCERTEAAGVRCHARLPPTTPPPPTTTRRPTVPIGEHHRELRVRLAGGRNRQEGRVEVLPWGHTQWGTVCGDGWGVREAMVVCRELGLRYAHAAMQTHLFNPPKEQNSTEIFAKPLLSGVSCKGNEEELYECSHHGEDLFFCPGEGIREVAAVACVDEQADLEPDLYELMSSVHLEDKQLFFLQCAMEENCLASEAYRLRHERYDYSTEVRRLMRFTAAIANVGNADFLPFIPRDRWQWHGCHQHYHSMEVFAHYDVIDASGKRMAEGHKASFCLEDNFCSGVDPKYDCENYGPQGITAGCKDVYYSNIDCQWIDVTELPLGTYTLRVAINPEYKVPEQTFENNAAHCVLVYTEQFASVRNCSLTRP